MKYYTICFPGECGQHVSETWSEDQIIESYYDYWCAQMRRKFENPYLSKEFCIEDWCTVHWAKETNEWEHNVWRVF